MFLFNVPRLPELLQSRAPGRFDALLRNAGMTDADVARFHEEVVDDGAFPGGLAYYRGMFLPDPALRPHGFALSRGELIDLDEVGAQLVACGYQRVEQVEERGQFAVRGDILDLYPATEERAVRCELFDVEIEEDEVDTVGGLIGKSLGRVPILGSHCEVAGLSLTAERMAGRRHRIASVVVGRVPERGDSSASVEPAREGVS